MILFTCICYFVAVPFSSVRHTKGKTTSIKYQYPEEDHAPRLIHLRIKGGGAQCFPVLKWSAGVCVHSSSIIIALFLRMQNTSTSLSSLRGKYQRFVVRSGCSREARSISQVHGLMF